MPSDAEHKEGLRRGDIATFAAEFTRAVCDSSGHARLELSWTAVFALEQADWENVSALAKVVTAAVARAHAEGSKRIERRHIFPTQRQWTSFHDATRSFQEQYLRDVLEREDWNLAAVARALDLTRTHVYNLMGTFQIRRPKERPSVDA
jgi:transcriptional regulator with GAF, ATPase, and Fis domain